MNRDWPHSRLVHTPFPAYGLTGSTIMRFYGVQNLWINSPILVDSELGTTSEGLE